MILAACAQELWLDIFKFALPDLLDGLDLLYDVVGFAIAYLIVWGWQTILQWKKR